MTEFHVEVVRIGRVDKHPNADTLSIATIHDNYPVLFKTGEYKTGDLAVYIPVDAVVPNTPEWAWLAPKGGELREKDRRIKAKRLRGVFSMGLLTKAPEGAVLGENVAERLGITKYDPDTDAEPNLPRIKKAHIPRPKGLVGLVRWLFWSLWLRFFGPKDLSRPVGPPKLPRLPGVYDIEPFRKYGKHWFWPGELCVVTEKIHGQNASFVHDGKALHVKSRTRWRRNDPTEDGNTWAQVAKKYEIESKLKSRPGMVLFGETYGNNSDMPYGVERQKTGDAFMAFDVFDANVGRFLDYLDFIEFCAELKIPVVPELARVMWTETAYEEILPLAEGKTTLAGGHVREGFVIRPLRERIVHGGQRVQLKMAGEGYLMRKTA